MDEKILKTATEILICIFVALQNCVMNCGYDLHGKDCVEAGECSRQVSEKILYKIDRKIAVHT